MTMPDLPHTFAHTSDDFRAWLESEIVANRPTAFGCFSLERHSADAETETQTLALRWVDGSALRSHLGLSRRDRAALRRAWPEQVGVRFPDETLLCTLSPTA